MKQMKKPACKLFLWGSKSLCIQVENRRESRSEFMHILRKSVGVHEEAIVSDAAKQSYGNAISPTL